MCNIFCGIVIGVVICSLGYWIYISLYKYHLNNIREYCHDSKLCTMIRVEDGVHGNIITYEVDGKRYRKYIYNQYGYHLKYITHFKLTKYFGGDCTIMIDPIFKKIDE